MKKYTNDKHKIFAMQPKARKKFPVKMYDTIRHLAWYYGAKHDRFYRTEKREKTVTIIREW